MPVTSYFNLSEQVKTLRGSKFLCPARVPGKIVGFAATDPLRIGRGQVRKRWIIGQGRRRQQQPGKQEGFALNQ
jgi:hypothetical protein